MKSIYRQSTAMRTVLFHLGLIGLAGLFVIDSLLLEPSQAGGFLGFSIGRWGILLVNLLMLAGICFAFYKVWTNRTEKLEIWLSQESHLFLVFFFAVILFAFSLPAGSQYVYVKNKKV